MSLRNRILLLAVLLVLFMSPIAGQAASPDINPDGQPLAKLTVSTADFETPTHAETAPQSLVVAPESAATNSGAISTVLSRFLSWLQATVQPL